MVIQLLKYVTRVDFPHFVFRFFLIPLFPLRNKTVLGKFLDDLEHLCFSHQYFAPSSISSLVCILAFVFRRENSQKSWWRWSRDPKKHETKSHNFLGGETFSEVRSMEYNQEGNAILRRFTLFWFTASLKKLARSWCFFKFYELFFLRKKIEHTKAI